MNTMKMALSYAGVQQTALGEALGVSKQQVHMWVTGERNISDKYIPQAAEFLGVDEALLAGHPAEVYVWSPADKTGFTFPTIKTIEIEGYGLMRMVYCDDLAKEITVIESEGLQFTPWDWQYQQPRTVEEVAEYDWVTPYGAKAIMMDGLPRVLV